MKQFLIKVCKIREKNINFSRIFNESYIYIFIQIFIWPRTNHECFNSLNPYKYLFSTNFTHLRQVYELS